MEIVPYTLLDDLPRRVLSSIPNCIKEFSKLYDDEAFDMIIVGGFAVQLHLHDKELFRPTNDMDISPSNIASDILNASQFNESIFKILQRTNPQYNMKRGQNKNGYEICIDPSSTESRSLIETGKPAFYVHFNQFSKNYRKRHFDWKMREIENADEISLSQLNLPEIRVKTFRIEDIIANKIRRLGYYQNYLTVDEKNRFQALKMGEWETVSSIDFVSELKRINSLFELAELDNSHFGNEKSDYAKHFKVRKDLYDIATLLFEVYNNKLEFSEKYFETAVNGLHAIEKL